MQLKACLSGDLRFFDVRLISIFLLSRLLFMASGVEFLGEPLGKYWQYLDVEILANNLAEGLLFQHSQPPLFNLLLGLMLKLFPDYHLLMLQLIFLLCGYFMYAATCRIFAINGMRTWLCVLMGTIIIVSPGAILYENLLFYSWPIAAVLVCAAYGLWSAGKYASLGYVLLFLVCITAACLMRSMFHLLFFAGAAVFIFFVNSASRKHLVMLSLTFAAVVLAVFIKNLILFGFFGSSSWMGMNAWRVVQQGVASDAIAIAVDSKEVPEIALYKPFGAIDSYPPGFAAVPEPYSRIESLAAPEKRNGRLNFNHYGYIEISAQFQQASLAMIRRYPLEYAGVVWKGIQIYLRPTDDNVFMRQNVTKLQGYINIFSLRSLRSRLESVVTGRGHNSLPISSYLAIPLMLLIASIYVLRQARRNGLRKTVPLLFMLYTIWYVTILSVTLEYGENNRFHVMTDQLLLIVVILAVRSWLPGRVRSGGSA